MEFIPGNTIFGMVELRVLYLDGNKLITLANDSFEHLINLNRLYLQNNNIKS